MNDNQRNTILRFAIVFFVMVCLFGAVIGKIIHTQTVEREFWMKAAEKMINRSGRTVPAHRGDIYDCNGKLLATSIRLYTVSMDTQTEALTEENGQLFKEHVGELCDSLAAYFQDKSAKEYKAAFMKAYQKKDRNFRFYGKRTLTYEQFQTVKKMPLFELGQYTGGLKYEERTVRIKPFGGLASRTIGNIYSDSKIGHHGIEKAFEKELHGQDGFQLRQLKENYAIDFDTQETKNGYDIITTLDADLQDVVDNNLRRELQFTNADWGCCILMEVKTGEIKAISNLTRTETGTYIEDRNYAVIRTDPGSTFKTYSLMAALDDGKVEITDSIDVEGGNWKYSDAVIRDSHRYNTTEGYPEPKTVRKSFAVSSNVALAKIITTAYEKKASRFVDKLAKMGVCDNVPLEIPGKTQPHIVDPKDGVTLAKMSYGYFVELSPIDILMFYNAIANEGKMIRPFLVKGIQENGKVIKEFDTETVKGSICKASTLKDIRTCLEDVVWDMTAPGTAAKNKWGTKKAQSDLVKIAGKTGTAQLYENGRYRNDQHRMSFCGYFPMDNPEYTCICVIQRPRVVADAGWYCGETVRRIAEKTMAYESCVSSKYLYMHPDSILKPNIKRGLQVDIRRAAKGVDVDVEYADSEWIRVNEDYEAEPLKVVDNLVPNVIGMGAKDAVFAIEQTGMYVKLSGKGRVRKQSVPSGSRVVRGGTVYLELR